MYKLVVVNMAEEYDVLFQSFVTQARTLGIPDEGLQKYVQGCFERLDRQKEREYKQKELELEAKQREKEIELEMVLEVEKTKRLQLDVQNRVAPQDDSADTGIRTADRGIGARPIYPKIPMFKERQDDIDSYLFRFETHATALGWDRTKWVTYLSALLDGNALNLYHSLASKGSVDYASLKVNLLKKFQCTSEGFRKRFREARPDGNEPFQTYGIELNRLFDRWVALSGVPKTMEGIIDLVLGEQFLESVSHELATFIRERNLVTLDAMVQAAESYRLARPGKILARKASTNVFGSVGDVEEPADANAFSSYNRPNNYRGRYHRGRGNGQVQRDSPVNDKPNSGSTSPKMNRRGRGRGGFYNTGNETCLLCRGRGHFPKQCPLRQSTNPCSVCGIGGHVRKSCPFVLRDGKQSENQASGNAVSQVDTEVVCSLLEDSMGHINLEKGLVNDIPCSVLRDTGASICGIRRRLITDDQYVAGTIRCKTFGGEIQEYKRAKVTVSTPYFSGELICCVLEDPVADIIIGNIKGLMSSKGSFASAVTTRAQAKREAIPHIPLVKAVDDLQVNRHDLAQFQKDDVSLETCFQLAQSGEEKTLGAAKYTFYLKEDVLYREFKDDRKTLHQIVVPTTLRPSLLTAAHDQLLAGHCGVRRTLNRILQKFFWRGINTDVRKYVQTCDVCQKAVPKGKVCPVPLSQVTLKSDPFDKVAIDIVGPLSPPTDLGHRYILTLIDLATRFPEAVPLKNITSVDVAEALLSIFSRLGFPREILSDQGSQFNSDLMKQFHALCGTKAVRTSPYHPQANGTVERFHGTLKAMLKKIIYKQPRAWHRYLPALLFACRELRSESTGFSPFELMFGRLPRGPMALIADSWTQNEDPSDVKTEYAYLFELKNILVEVNDLAMQNTTYSAKKNKKYFDRKAKMRIFSVNDEVLVLLPTSSNKLLMTWSGPFKVTECLHPDYRIELKGKNKIFHANMLKKYLRREGSSAFDQEIGTRTSVGDTIDWNDITVYLLSEATSDSTDKVYIPEQPPLQIPSAQSPTSTSIGVVHEDEDSVELHVIPSNIREDVSMININSELSDDQASDLYNIFAEFPDILTADPGIFSGDVFLNINLTSDIPIRRKPYDLPFTSKQIVEHEIETMLQLGVIEKSKSAYSSPVVLVRKKDGTCRFCIDYRALNKVTVFDAEPIPDVDELFTRLANSEYFTKIDLSKGYWQIVVDPLDRHKTAFATHLGLYQWLRMPFGLVSAPAVFARMMRSLQLDPESSLNFFDDVLIHSQTFQSHCMHVKDVLTKLKQFHLTARPSKITSGYKTIEFLGHVVGKGVLKPGDVKIRKILEIPTPTTKKQVRALLGLLSFYRRYIPNFATLTSPISDLTKESKARTITWTPVCEEALRKIKSAFSSAPVLKLPRLSDQFTLRTDASSVGLGAVLLQDFDGVLHPVCFASRKLLDRERRYSTIERECLAIVWSISKFSKFLWGSEFVLQTDHKPLTYLQTSKFKNSRIMRWSLSLQEYRFSVEPLPGTQNVLADLLSRADLEQSLP